jgi:E3 ubiquitin-protein ligase synoviolin
MKFWGYFGASALAYLSVIYYAIYTHQQFYPVVLFLVTSKVSFVFGGNMCLAILLVVARVFKTIFFSNLREAEIEMLVEKSKYFITETCLALTIFRNELTLPVMTLFTTLIFVKLFHRLAKTRAQYLEQIMPISRFANLQVAFLFLNLVIIDLYGIHHAVSHILLAGKSVVLLFGFEFGLLLVHVVNTMVRFILHTVDANMENGE